MTRIDLSKLDHSFIKKPLLIGGKAMEYYGLRKAGKDIDLVVCYEDIVALVKKYPDHTKNLLGDFGVNIYGFEIWKTICFFDYDYLSPGAIEEKEYLVISLEKLLFLKALAMHAHEKYRKDVELIAKKINHDQGKYMEKISKENDAILH